MSYSAFGWQLLVTLYSPATVAILALVIASLCRRDQVRRRDDFLTALGLAAFGGIAVQLHVLIIRLTPVTIDGRLLRIDHSLGLDPNQLFSWLFGKHPHWLGAFLLVYVMLAPMIAITWIIERSHALRRALVLGAIFCWFFYALFPAVGPIYYSRAAMANMPRNCVPSMHFSWALMLALNSHSWLRWPLWIYAGLIGISTIALGQHYFIDLIVALPYTAAIQIAAKSLTGLPKPSTEYRSVEAGTND